MLCWADAVPEPRQGEEFAVFFFGFEGNAGRERHESYAAVEDSAFYGRGFVVVFHCFRSRVNVDGPVGAEDGTEVEEEREEFGLCASVDYDCDGGGVDRAARRLRWLV
jgi:hypothetical protein